MRIGNSKRLIGICLAAGVLMTAGGAWAQPNLPVVRADAKGQVTAKALCASVNNYSAVSTTTSSASAVRQKAAATDPVAAYHAAIHDPKTPLVVKCNLVIQHKRLNCASTDIGGPLGGMLEHATSEMEARLICKGLVSPITFTLSNVNFTVATAPHSDQAAGQSFDTQMYAIEATATDVPGFASIHLIGGSGNGFPSPGHTTLVPTADEGVYVVDSTFTIGYRIDYVGAEGGPLEGGSGTLEGNATMKAFGR